MEKNILYEGYTVFENGLVLDLFGNKLDTFYVDEIEWLEIPSFGKIQLKRFVKLAFGKSLEEPLPKQKGRSKIVAVYNESEVFIGYYESIRAASKAINISTDNIKRLIRGDREIHKGFKIYEVSKNE